MTATSTSCPGATFPVRGTALGALMAFPLTNTTLYELVQVQAPMFFNRQVLIKATPGFSMVPSGMVSEMNWASSQTWVGARMGVTVGAERVAGMEVAVAGMTMAGMGVSVAELPVAGSWTYAVTVCATIVAAAPELVPVPADWRLQARIARTSMEMGTR